MREAVVSFLQQYNLSSEAIIFIISMLPVVELRGGLVAAKLLGVPLIRAYLVCFAGNMLPIPFILLFIKKIFFLLKKWPLAVPYIRRLEANAIKKSDGVRNRQMAGLFAFVAVPLPGTGGWTGALIASLLNMPVQKSFVTIMGGVLSAGVIMTILSYFIPGLFGF